LLTLSCLVNYVLSEIHVDWTRGEPRNVRFLAQRLYGVYLGSK
jgi:hypothetical protein